MAIASLRRLLAVLGLAAGLAACSSVAPPYQPSVASADVTARLGDPIAVGKFGFAPGREVELNAVGARASVLYSPVNNSFADYFADAAQKELKAGGKLDPASAKVLTGTITKNDLTAADLSVNKSDLVVRFKLADAGRTTFEKDVEANRAWDSSFLGGIAIPRAYANYVATIQDLLRKLFGDPDFVAATGGK
jgi:hypothetical protein